MKKILLLTFSLVFSFGYTITKYEINFFGFTKHFNKQYYNNQNVFNPGIGINLYLEKNLFITVNWLKNCEKKRMFLTGFGINLPILSKIHLNIGSVYIKTKYYEKEYHQWEPIYYLSYNINNKWSINTLYVPKTFSVTKKDDFVFFFLSYKI